LKIGSEGVGPPLLSGWLVCSEGENSKRRSGADLVAKAGDATEDGFVVVESGLSAGLEVEVLTESTHHASRVTEDGDGITGGVGVWSGGGELHREAEDAADTSHGRCLIGSEEDRAAIEVLNVEHTHQHVRVNPPACLAAHHGFISGEQCAGDVLQVERFDGDVSSGCGSCGAASKDAGHPAWLSE